MQATASLAEDVRQPPYLCPVDLAKILRATRVDERVRYQALLIFCEQFEDGDVGWFKALGAWIAGRLRELEEVGTSLDKETAGVSLEGKAASKKAAIELSP